MSFNNRKSGNGSRQRGRSRHDSNSHRNRNSNVSKGNNFGKKSFENTNLESTSRSNYSYDEAAGIDFSSKSSLSSRYRVKKQHRKGGFKGFKKSDSYNSDNFGNSGKFDKTESRVNRNRGNGDDGMKVQESSRTVAPARRNSGGSRKPRTVATRPSRGQKTMDVDYKLMVKKATPQAIEDYVPKKDFKQHGLHPELIKNLEAKGYTQPTPIQDQAIPVILSKKDIIGIANTGTGKTAAFLLPLIHQIHENPKKRVLVLAPTRELVNQIAAELQSFTKYSRINATVVIGGESAYRQNQNLQKRNNFIISTTGRGLDLINQGTLPIREIDTIVLDEMDQMLDMGFIRDIRKILELAVNKRHLLFFSATINDEVERIASEILRDPIFISVVKGKTSDNVNQDVVEIAPEESKLDKLCEILSRPEVEKAIVFENTKHGSARIERELVKRGFKALAIHGNKNQNQRNRALQAFKDGIIDVLIATNVAARGLDIPLVSHVINYSLPQSKDDYIHRIGRTGRAGEIGHAYTFVQK